MFEWTDKLQSIQIGEYAFERQRQVTQKGFHGGGRAPYGYRTKQIKDPDGKTGKDGRVVEHVTFEVAEEEARVVRRIFKAYASMPGYKRIAGVLNDEGITSPSGGTWDTSGVRQNHPILSNEELK